MAYPPAALPTNATDGTSASDTTPTAVLTAAEVNAANAAVNDIVAELGSNPSGASATVGARLDGIEADVTALGSGSIPDGSVSTAKLANGAVTAAKVAADVATQAELDAETAARTAAIAGLSATYVRTVNGTGPDGSGNVTVSGGGGGTVVTPESHGAKGDGVLVVDGVITTGTAAFSSASAVFTSADVGKRMWINGAGAAGDALHTTISAFVDATHVTLAANAGTSVSGAFAIYGTDDTAAVQAAIDAVVVAKGGTVQFAGKIYVLAASPRTDRGGNAVVALPNTPNGSNLAQGYLRLAGVSDMAGYQPDGSDIHRGTVLFCPLVGQTYSATYGPPSVIGGPTKEQIWLTWSRHQVDVENLCVMVTTNPSVCGLDLTGIVRARLRGYAGMVACPQSGIAQPTRNWAFGVRMPSISNYDLSLVESGIVCGFYANWVINTEHFTAVDMVSHRGLHGLCLDSEGGWHGSVIQKLSVEYCPNVITSSFSNAGGPTNGATYQIINIQLLDIEETPPLGPAWMAPTNGYTVNDSQNVITGTVSYLRAYGGLTWGPMRMNGGNGLRLIDLIGQRKQVTPDSSPFGAHAMLMGETTHNVTTTTGPTGFGSALNCNGNGVSAWNASCIDMGLRSYLQPNGAPFTVECKIKRNVTSGAYEIIGTMGNAAWVLALSNANKLYLALNGSIVVTSSGTITADGNWHDVAGVWSGTTAYVFIDGAVTSAAAASAPSASGQSVRFGAAPDGTSRFNGAIDEIRISNAARYTGAYTPATAPFEPDGKTLGLWHCDLLLRAAQLG